VTTNPTVARTTASAAPITIIIDRREAFEPLSGADGSGVCWNATCWSGVCWTGGV
jgi:hypothetical protein